MATFRYMIVILFALVIGVTCFQQDYHTNCTASFDSSPPGICPTWFVPNLKTRRCDCSKENQSTEFLQCKQGTNLTYITNGVCVTYNKTSKLTVVGQCPYNTVGTSAKENVRPLLEEVLELNNEMCGPLNRTGLLCSQCQEGLGPAVLSYYRECLECMDEPYGWILYFFVTTFQTTIFFVLVIIFQINAASPSLNGFVLAAQIFTNTFNYNPFFFRLEHGILIAVATLYGFWNLDFFRYLIPAFCTKEGMSMLTVIALEYTVALYPIFFTVVVYYCITLHDNGCRVLVCCWKPFHRCFVRFRRTWELKGSVINAFATFLLLSYSKLCTISFSLLQSIKVIDVCGGKADGIYYDASYVPLSKEHTPYVVLSSTIITVFICLPALFILFYQNKFFQKCLNFCKFKCVLIHELANICQGCFKNGTSPGTRDYRWFAGLYLILRTFVLVTINHQYHQLVFQVIYSIMAVLVATLRPYRVDFYNTVDTILFLLFSLASSFYVYSKLYGDVSMLYTLAIVLTPLVYVTGYVTVKVLKFTVRQCRLLITRPMKSFITASEENNTQENKHQLPQRLLEQSECTPLISTPTEPNDTHARTIVG